MGRLIERHDTGVAVALLTIWTAATVLAHWGSWSVDMSAIYMAGRFAAQGHDAAIYMAPHDFFSRQPPQVWVDELAPFGHAESFAVPFVYPPVWAFLAAPFAQASAPEAFFDATRIVTTAAFAGTILAAWRLMRPAGMSATIFAAVSVAVASVTVPFLFSASLNQPQAVVIFLIVLAFERYAAGRPAAAGLALGLAAAIKVTPIFLAVIFLADRNWRAALWAGGTAAAIGAASLAVAGPDLHLTFLDRVRQIEGLMPLIGFNMTFETVMHDFFVPMENHPTSINKALFVDTPWVSLLSRVLALAAVAAALWTTRTAERTLRIRLRLILVYLAVVFFSPLAWMHYYTLPLLLAPGMLGAWGLRRTALVTGLLVAGFSEILMVGWFDYTLDHGIYTLYFAQHLPFVPLVVFAVLAARTAREPVPATAPAGTARTGLSARP